MLSGSWLRSSWSPVLTLSQIAARSPTVPPWPPADQPTGLERAERCPHRLRADLLQPGERARCRRAAAVQARQGRTLGQRELAVGLRLAQAPQEQADAYPERAGDLVDVGSLRHISK